jgi:hypothetical protein
MHKYISRKQINTDYAAVTFPLAKSVVNKAVSYAAGLKRSG